MLLCGFGDVCGCVGWDGEWCVSLTWSVGMWVGYRLWMCWFGMVCGSVGWALICSVGLTWVVILVWSVGWVCMVVYGLRVCGLCMGCGCVGCVWNVGVWV